MANAVDLELAWMLIFHAIWKILEESHKDHMIIANHHKKPTSTPALYIPALLAKTNILKKIILHLKYFRYLSKSNITVFTILSVPR